MDTMFLTKIVGSFCAAMLVLMCGSWAASAIYTVGDGGGLGDHGEGHAVGYLIEVEGDDDHGDDDAEEAIDVMALVAAADVGKGEKVFGKCKSCHKLEDGKNGTGPTLYGIVDNDIGSVAGFGYSGILTELPGDWTAEALFGFLTKPKEYAPGTKMNFAGLKKPEDRANLIAYLATIGE